MSGAQTFRGTPIVPDKPLPNFSEKLSIDFSFQIKVPDWIEQTGGIDHDGMDSYIAECITRCLKQIGWQAIRIPRK